VDAERLYTDRRWRDRRGRAAQRGRSWRRVPGLPALGPRTCRRRGPRRAALTMILAEPEAVTAARTIQSLAGRACRVVPGGGAVLHQRRWRPGRAGPRAGQAASAAPCRASAASKSLASWPAAADTALAYSCRTRRSCSFRARSGGRSPAGSHRPGIAAEPWKCLSANGFRAWRGHGLAAPASPCPASCSPLLGAGLHAQVWCGPACPGQRAGGTAGCSPKKRMNSALASGPRGSV
jgi:hypothetical protein